MFVLVWYFEGFSVTLESVLELLALVDQAGLEPTEIRLPLEYWVVYHHRPALGALVELTEDPAT